MYLRPHYFVIYFVCFVFIGLAAAAQDLKPGFDADEYIGVLERGAMQVDKAFRGKMPKELHYERVYHSPEMGLHNKWDLWLSNDKKVIAINLRGTTSDPDSWLENFYSAMVPATGTLNLDGKNPFHYKFANDTKAMVHVGWALGACSLLPDITEKIQAWYAKGVKQFIVEGHSQGGAIAFLVSSYLHYQVAEGKLPKDLVIKTYCSAAPKPGNLYYAYDFDYISRGGWAYTVVSAADWVPEMPVSVQTKKDLNDNPYTFTKSSLKKQSFLVRYYINHIYKSMDRSTRKAQRKYEKYLGRMVYKQVKKYLKYFEQPIYAGSCNYMRAGSSIVLEPDPEYYIKFPQTNPDIFRNHLFEPYYYLVTKIYK
jgi:hypothetical protein